MNSSSRSSDTDATGFAVEVQLIDHEMVGSVEYVRLAVGLLGSTRCL